MSKGWDNATLKKLKALTCKGLSTSEIGKRLGMSKNAIVGKLNRLGWNAKAGGAAAAEVKDVETKKTATAKNTKTTKAVKVAKSVKKTTTSKVAATKKTVKAPKVTVTKKITEKAVKTTKGATKTKNVKVAAPKGADKKSAKVKDTKSSAKNLAVHQRIIQHSLEMANLKPNQCRWPIGDPDSEHFHFCGETVFVGKPYCYEHCKQAYQFTPPKKK